VDAFYQSYVKGAQYGDIEFYQKKMTLSTVHCDAQIILNLSQITPRVLSEYLLHLKAADDNSGGLNQSPDNRTMPSGVIRCKS